MGNIINCEKEIIEYFKKRSDVYFDIERIDKNVVIEGKSIKIYCSFFIYQNRTTNLFNRFIEKNNVDELHEMLLEHILPILKKHNVNAIKLTMPSSVSSNGENSTIIYYITNDSVSLIGHGLTKLW